ncbi:unnamed protein product, partial [marine sediment metagenome]
MKTPSQLTQPTKLTRFEDIIAWQEALKDYMISKGYI